MPGASFSSGTVATIRGSSGLSTSTVTSPPAAPRNTQRPATYLDRAPRSDLPWLEVMALPVRQLGVVAVVFRVVVGIDAAVPRGADDRLRLVPLGRARGFEDALPLGHVWVRADEVYGVRPAQHQLGEPSVVVVVLRDV